MPTTNVSTLVTSAICITYLILFKELINPRIKKRFKIEFPSELLLVCILNTFKILLCS